MRLPFLTSWGSIFCIMLQHRDMGRQPGIIPHKKPKSFLVSQSAPTCCDGHHCEGKALGDVKSIVLEEGVFVYFYCVFHRDDGLGWDPGGPISCGNFSPGREGVCKRQRGESSGWHEPGQPQTPWRRKLQSWVDTNSSLEREREKTQTANKTAGHSTVLWQTSHKGLWSFNFVGLEEEQSGEYLLPGRDERCRGYIYPAQILA